MEFVELANKNRIYLLLNMQHHRIIGYLTKILLLGLKKQKHSWRVTNVGDHPYVNSQTLPPLPKQLKVVAAATQ